MKVLALSPDVYGSFARFSAVADFLELSALRNPKRPLREPDLARRLDKDDIQLGSPLGPSTTDPNRAASIVFGILSERSRILGSRYPFSVTSQDGLRTRTKAVGAYRVLLAFTTAHAHRIKTHDPKKLFEGFVARSLGKIGMRTTTTGTARPRGSGGFGAMLHAACSDVGLSATPTAVTLSTHAQDEKVDTLGHIDFQDGRSGRWTFIGQATLAESGEWEKKAAEPKPKAWGPLLTDTHRPSAFLAVPHHVEDSHLLALHEREDAIVLDRLRLARPLVQPTPDEREVVRAVAGCRVEW